MSTESSVPPAPRTSSALLVLLERWLLPVLAGGIFAWASRDWLSLVHLTGPVTASDFHDYCLGVLSLRDGDPALWPPRRSRLAAVLAVPWEGVASSLSRSALLASVLVGGGLFAWAREVGGRWAGPAAVGVALALAPLTVLPRMWSFYPTLTATFVVSAALVAAAVRRGGAWLLPGALGVAACLLVDVRGVFWAAPLGLLLLLTGLLRRQILWTAGAVVVVALSFPVGRAVYPDRAVSLESQVNLRDLVVQHGGADPGRLPLESQAGFVWGQASPSTWPATARHLAAQLRQSPAVPSNWRLQPPRYRSLVLWQTGLGAGLTALAVVVLLARRRYAQAAALLTSTPFWLGLYGTLQALDLQVRFLSQTFPALAVGVGALLGAVLSGRPRTALCALTLLALLVAGWVPSPLGPDADWRRRWPVRTAKLEEVRGHQSGARPSREPHVQRCAASAGSLLDIAL